METSRKLRPGGGLTLGTGIDSTKRVWEREKGNVMTRKDYELIARALANTPDGGDVKSQWEECVSAIADALARDNPRFSRERFYKACGQDGIPS